MRSSQAPEYAAKPIPIPHPSSPSARFMPRRNNLELTSLNAYGGFVLLMVMVVDYIEVTGMPGIPHWLKHAAATEDGFTFPDLVFSGFLLLIGLTIPRTFAQESGQPRWRILGRILMSGFGLLVVGVTLNNSYRYDEGAAILPQPLYKVLFFTAVMVLWFQGQGKKAWMTWLAAAVLTVLMLLFRGHVGYGYQGVYLEHGWWGMLGLIGWAYLFGSILFLASGGSGTALMGALALMLVVYMGDAKGQFAFLPQALRDFVGIGSVLGSTSANVMAGIIAGRWVAMDEKPGTGLRPLAYAALFAAGMIAAGYMLRPYHPISKIGATETYTLISAGLNLLAFLVFYAIMDILKWRAWAIFLVPAGANFLFAYVIPDYFDSLAHMVGLGPAWRALGWPYAETGGWPGILNAVVMSIFMMSLVYAATRLGLRVKFEPRQKP